MSLEKSKLFVSTKAANGLARRMSSLMGISLLRKVFWGYSYSW